MNDNSYLNDVSKSGPAGMSGFMLGAIVGAAAALLFAPGPGTDTRRRVGETVRKLGGAARDRLNEGRDLVEKGRHGLENAIGGERQGEFSQQSQGRREPVPSGGTPGQTGRTTPGKTGPQGSTYTP
jgi:gas vesicle protein